MWVLYPGVGNGHGCFIRAGHEALSDDADVQHVQYKNKGGPVRKGKGSRTYMQGMLLQGQWPQMRMVESLLVMVSASSTNE